MRTGGWVVLLVVSLAACRHRDFVDGQDSILVEVDLPPTDAVADEVSAETGLGFGIAQHRLIALVPIDDAHEVAETLDRLASGSTSYQRATFTLTALPGEETIHLRRGVFDRDNDQFRAMFERDRSYRMGLPRMQLLAAEHVALPAPRAAGKLPSLVPALAGDALVWSGGDILPDGTVRVRDLRATSQVTITSSSGQLLDDLVGVPVHGRDRHVRELVCRAAGGTLVHEWWRTVPHRTLSQLVWTAADGSERRTRVLHGLTRIAISPTHEFVAVVAHRDGTPVLLRFAIPTLEMAELASLAFDVPGAPLAIDDEGVATAEGGQETYSLAMYDGRATTTLVPPQRPETGAHDEVLAFDAKTMTVANIAVRSNTGGARVQLVAIDRATQARRVLSEQDEARPPMARQVFVAGDTWYVASRRSMPPYQLDAIDASGERHTGIASLGWWFVTATAPDGRLAVQSDGKLRIFKDGVLVGEAPVAGSMTGLAFRTVAH